MKKLLVLILVMTLSVTSLFGCGKKDNDAGSEKVTDTNKADQQKGEETQLPKVVKYSVLAPKFDASPEGTIVHEEWKKRMEEHLGVKLELDIQWISYQELKDKVKVVFASGDLPDIVMGFGEIEAYADEDMLLDISKYDTPNYDAKLAKAGHFKKTITHDDGAIYGFFDGGMSKEDDQVGYANYPLYRFDLFKKHNIKVPETFDEFYDAAVKLKELYPDVYPVGTDSNIMFLVGTVATFNHSSRDFYWDGKEFRNSLFDEGYKDAVAFLSKLYADGLLDPEFIVMDKKQHTTKNTTGKTFMILNSYAARAAGYNRTEGFEGQWGYGHALASEKYGKGMNFYPRFGGGVNFNDSAIGISKDVKHPEIAVKLLDYQYSPEILEILNWGIEGETYVVDDKGEKQWKDEILAADDVRKELSRYGVSTSMKVRSGIPFTLQMGEPNSKITSAELAGLEFSYDGKYEETPIHLAHVLAKDPTQPRPPMYVLSDEDREFKAQNYTPVKTYQKEQLASFILGNRDMAEWDKFLEEVQKFGDVQGYADILNQRAKELADK